MKIEIVVGKNLRKVDLIVVPVFENYNFKEIFKEYPGVEYFVEKYDFKGKIGDEIIYNSLENKKLFLLVGAGNNTEVNNARKLAKNLMKTLIDKKVFYILIEFIQDIKLSSEFFVNFIDYLFISHYSFDTYLSKEKKAAVEKIDIFFVHRNGLSDSIIEQRKKIAENIDMVRDMVNETPAKVNPDYMVNLSGKLAENNQLELCVFREKELKNNDLNGILAVGRASPFEPALIKLSYTPAQYKKTISIVGKGITFDSGGVIIKEPPFMKKMKSDMAGAAAVMGIIKAASDLKLPVKIHGIVAVAENMTGQASYKPGDIIIFRNRKTVEVTDTDAEGRIALADALLFAQNDRPDYIIELSTLTGWIFVALGDICAGLMTNDRKLADILIQCGKKTGEYLWELPMLDEYKEDIKSKIADLKNYDYHGAHSIKAGLFLTEFTGNVPFAHIDIAGTAFISDSNPFYLEAGATGFGVRLITEFLQNFTNSIP